MNFEKAFHDLLNPPQNTDQGFVVEVKLLPYGVAREYYPANAFAADVDSGRMYLVRTIVYPHGLETATCRYLYAAVTTLQDAATRVRASDQIQGACDPRHVYKTSSPAPVVHSYSVFAIGMPGVPRLTTDELTVLNRILAKLPPYKRSRIRFVFSGPEGGAKNNFYVLDPGTAPPTGMIGGGIQTFRVLNGSCNLFYEPERDYVFAGTSCGPDPEITG